MVGLGHAVLPMALTDIDQGARGAAQETKLIRVLDRTPTAATMKDPHPTPASGLSPRPGRTTKTTASQGDHHAIFNPERAPYMDKIG